MTLLKEREEGKRSGKSDVGLTSKVSCVYVSPVRERTFGSQRGVLNLLFKIQEEIVRERTVQSELSVEREESGMGGKWNGRLFCFDESPKDVSRNVNNEGTKPRRGEQNRTTREERKRPSVSQKMT